MSTRIGRVILGRKDNRNKVIGLQMFNSILDIAFNKFKLHRVDLGVFDFIYLQLNVIRKLDL
ncbi:hypothetical protein [Clostridium sp.]|uniref:hypothetical protein n=1 Tax=Clostridium sp. TaxID=1506 RepID=UPI00290EE4F5|nr:hypothetical protein [Clostridium sp.]MDU5107305.1 hypothetical protein [Clostridium sp.]